MIYKNFLDRVIDDGIKAAKESYKEARNKTKLEGAIEGFEACRYKTSNEIRTLLDEATKATREAHHAYHEGKMDIDSYWRIRCREAEIEWVANCVSASLVNSGEKPIVNVTARG